MMTCVFHNGDATLGSMSGRYASVVPSGVVRSSRTWAVKPLLGTMQKRLDTAAAEARRDRNQRSNIQTPKKGDKVSGRCVGG